MTCIALTEQSFEKNVGFIGILPKERLTFPLFLWF